MKNIIFIHVTLIFLLCSFQSASQRLKTNFADEIYLTTDRIDCQPFKAYFFKNIVSPSQPLSWTNLQTNVKLSRVFANFGEEQ